MNFLYPAFLAGALAVAIPIVLHLLRRGVAPEVPFSAVRLLRATPPEEPRRRQLRELLLLAARIAAVVLLAAAFARPYFADASGSSTLDVIAIDRSFSMGAPGRFARALTLAREAIDGAPGTRVAVVAFDDTAEVVADPGTKGEAASALARLRPSSGATQYEPAVTKTIELAAGEPVRLTIVTDMQRAGWKNAEPMPVPGEVSLSVVDAGGEVDNVAVTAARRESAAIVAAVAHRGAQARTGTAHVLVGGRRVGSAPFSVPAAGSVDVRIPFSGAARGGAAVEVDDPTGFAADNRRYLVLEPSPGASVLVIGADAERSGFYLTRALETGLGRDAIDVRVVTGPAFSKEPADRVTAARGIVLLSTRGVDRRGREMLAAFVRAGGGLMVAASPDVDPVVIGPAMGWNDFRPAEQPSAAALTVTDLRHPVFRPFGPLAANLGQVRFTRGWKVAGDGWDVIARFTDGSPALLERRDGAGRSLLFASDLDRRWNDFPLHASFVPFVIESVRHVSRAGDERRDYLVGEAPAAAKGEPGIHILEGGRPVAVNVDPRESLSVRMPADEFTAMVHRLPSADPEAGDPRAELAESRQSLWRYGLMLMLGVLVVESAVGRSR